MKPRSMVVGINFQQEQIISIVYPDDWRYKIARSFRFHMQRYTM